MPEAVKLSASDLEGAEDLPPAPPVASEPARAPVKLSAADLEGATDIGTPEAPKDERGFFSRAYDSIASGAHAVGHVVGEQNDFLSRAIVHPIDTFGTPEARKKAQEDFLLTNPAKRRELERGVDSMVTLGYGQKAARALEDTAFGRAWNKLATGQSEGSLSPEQEAKDRAAAGDYRTTGAVIGSFSPGAASGIAKVAGKIVAPIARAVAPAGAKVVQKLAAVPYAGPTLAPAAAGAGGAAKALLHYEASAPAIAALGADASGHRHEAAHEAAADPAGLLLSGGIGAAGPALGEAGQQTKRLTENLGEGAEKRVENRVFADLGNKATKTQRDAMDALAPTIKDAVETHGLADVAHDPVKLAEKSSEALKLVRSRHAEAQRSIGPADAGQFVSNLEDQLKTVEGVSPKAAKAIQAQIDTIKETYLPEPTKPQLTGKDLLAEMVKGGKGKNVERVGLKPEESLAVAQQHGLDKVADNPAAFATEARAATEKVGREIGRVYDAVPGAPDPGKYVGDLEQLAKSYQDNAQGAEAAAVRKHIADFRRAFQNPDFTPPTPNPEYAQLGMGRAGASELIDLLVSALRDEHKIPPEFVGGGDEWKPITTGQFHRYQSTLRGKAFATGILDPSAATQVARKIGSTANRALEAHMAEAAKADPEFAAEHAKLADLNKQFGALKNFADIGEKRLAKANVTPDEVKPPSKFPRDGKISVSALSQIAENHQPFDIVKRQFAEPKTVQGRVQKAIADAAAKTVDQAAGDRAPDLQRLAKEAEALDIINQSAAYKARALRYPVTGLRDVFDKTHRVFGSKILGRIVGTGEDKLLEKVRPLDKKLAQFAPGGRDAPTIDRLAKAALDAPSIGEFVNQAVRAGMPLAAAHRIAEAARFAKSGLMSKTQITGAYPGLVEPGNIDLTDRPNVANADGTHSSVRSMSFEDDGKEILVPTVSDDGRIMSDDEAIDQYRRTGKHLGKFETPTAADRYASALHEQQAAQGRSP